MVVGAYCAVAGWSLLAAVGALPIRSTLLHQPFVAFLAAAAVLAAVAAWTRFRIDRSSQNFLITVAFGALAVLYAPHGNAIRPVQRRMPAVVADLGLFQYVAPRPSSPVTAR